jgi:hypothetical protein
MKTLAEKAPIECTLPFCGVNYPSGGQLLPQQGVRIVMAFTRLTPCTACGSLAAVEAEYANGTVAVNCPQCAIRVQSNELEVEDEQAGGV